MKNLPKSTWNPQRLDARAFAQAEGQIHGELPLSDFDRLRLDLHAPNDAPLQGVVAWRLQGEMRASTTGGQAAVWLHLQASTEVPLACQRCLGPVMTPIEVDRWFRMVADEAAAEAEDDDCEEDLLALEPRPNLLEVLEDELLMGLPLVPMHEVCPEPVPMRSGEVQAQDAPPAKPNPFAGLAHLKKGG